MNKYRFGAERQKPDGYWMFAIIEVTANDYQEARQQVEALVARDTILGDLE